MDRADFQLLAQLHLDGLQGYRALARSTGLTAPTVSARLRNLNERGIMRGFSAHVDPGLFGMREMILSFAPDCTPMQVRRTRQAPGVSLVATKLDGGLTVALWCVEGDGRAEGVVTAVGASPMFQTLGSASTFPELSPLDWRVLRACLDEPRHTPSGLARRSGLTARTAVRRRDALLAKRALTIQPMLGAVNASGDLVYTMAIYGSPNKTEVERCLGDSLVINELASPPALFVLARASDLGDATSRIADLKKIPGVRDARISLNKEVWLNTEYVRGLVDARIEAWSAARPAVR